jgi:DNA-binding transcriptional regulator YdaS (Cro superfamily)
MDLKTYLDQERGRATKLAKEMGVSCSYISQLASGESPISVTRAVRIESLTDGLVTRKEMFPDDWEENWPELAVSSTRDKSSQKVDC